MMAFLFDHAQEIGLIFFLVFFSAVFVRVYVLNTSKAYDDCATIPLREDDHDQSK